MITGRIYKISSNIDMTFYYGSTTRTIQNRYEKHQYIYTNRTSKLYSHYDAIGWDKTRIHLIEEVEVRDKLELRIIESKYILSHISNPNCLNTNIPIHIDDFNINPYKFIITPTLELYDIISTKLTHKAALFAEYKSRNDVSNLNNYEIWIRILREKSKQKLADTLKSNIHKLSVQRQDFIESINTAVTNDSQNDEIKISF
jgi:hypothetical protein